VNKKSKNNTKRLKENKSNSPTNKSGQKFTAQIENPEMKSITNLFMKRIIENY
jgi:hypothetical protein